MEYCLELKGNIPRIDELVINGKLWYFSYSVNLYDERIYIEVMNESYEKVLQEPYPIVYGHPLFFQYITDKTNWNPNLPKALITPLFKNNASLKEINYINYNEAILYVREW